MGRGRQIPQDLQGGVRITPAANTPSNTPLASMPRSALTAVEKLAPLSQSFAALAGAARQQQQDARAAEGIQAFDAIEAEAAKAENMAAWRKLVQEGAAQLSNPHALKSYWRDAGGQRAALAMQAAQEQLNDIVTVSDGGVLRDGRGKPEDFRAAALDAIDAAFSEDLSGLPKEAQIAATAARQRFEEEFVALAVSTGVENLTKHNQDLKTARYRSALDELAEAGNFTEEASDRIEEMLESDFAEGFTSAQSPGMARDALASSTVEILNSFISSDQPEEGLKFLDFVRALRPGGHSIGEDPKYTATLENLEDRLQAAEDDSVGRSNRRFADAVVEQSNELFETYTGELRAIQEPWEREQRIQQILQDIDAGDHTEAVRERLEARWSRIGSDASMHNPKVFSELDKRVFLADTPEEMSALRDEVRAAVAGDRLDPAQARDLEARLRSKANGDPVRGSDAYQKLHSRTTPTVDLSKMDPDTRDGYLERFEDLQDGALQRLVGLRQEADAQADPEAWLAAEERKIWSEVRKDYQDLQAEVRDRQVYESDINEGWAVHLNMEQRIRQAYRDGDISGPERDRLLAENSRSGDMHSAYFHPGSAADRAMSSVRQAFLSSERGQAFLVATGGDPLSPAQLSEEGQLVLDDILEQARVRIEGRLNEELPRLSGAAANGRAATIAREVQREMMEDLFQERAGRTSESIEKAGDISTGIDEAGGSPTEDRADATKGIGASVEFRRLLDIGQEGRVEFAEKLRDNTGVFSEHRYIQNKDWLTAGFRGDAAAQNDFWSILDLNIKGHGTGTYKGRGAFGSYSREDHRMWLERALFVQAKGMSEAEDLDPEESRGAIMEMLRHRGFSGQEILNGQVILRMPHRRYEWFRSHGPVQDTQEDNRKWQGKDPLNILDTYQAYSTERSLVFDDPIVVEFDPAEEIDPYVVPLWRSVTRLETALQMQPTHVKEVLMSTGITEAELDDVIEAQKVTIRLHYGDTQ